MLLFLPCTVVVLHKNRSGLDAPTSFAHSCSHRKSRCLQLKLSSSKYKLDLGNRSHLQLFNNSILIVLPGYGKNFLLDRFWHMMMCGGRPVHYPKRQSMAPCRKVWRVMEFDISLKVFENSTLRFPCLCSHTADDSFFSVHGRKVEDPRQLYPYTLLNRIYSNISSHPLFSHMLKVTTLKK